MVLDQHRDRLDWWLVPLAKALRRVHPDVFTWTALAAAVAGGLAFWRSGPGALGLLLFAWAMVVLNSVLDLLDGKVAHMTGRASPRGDYLDHAVDRFSDVAFLAGLALSPWARVEVGLAAVAFTLLTSYLGTQAQAVGIGRHYGGLLGRADRMALLWVLPLVQYAVVASGWEAPWRPWSVSLLELMLMYFAAVGLLTTVQRFVSGYRAFDREGRVR